MNIEHYTYKEYIVKLLCTPESRWIISDGQEMRPPDHLTTSPSHQNIQINSINPCYLQGTGDSIEFGQSNPSVFSGKSDAVTDNSINTPQYMKSNLKERKSFLKMIYIELGFDISALCS